MSVFAENKAPKFASPTQLPESEEQRQEWLKANKTWWEKSPMRYDWLNGEYDKIPHAEFTKDFYQEIDRRFFSNAEEYAPSRNIPFDWLVDFDSLKDKTVLEIGCGNGSHAQLLSTYAGKYTGIDLTDYGVKSTSTRLKLFGLNKSKIVQMNAEEINFEDNSFDLVWSWGVVHASANPRLILKHIHRILRPGGKFLAMVYYRSFWSYYAFGLLAGIGRGYFFKGDSLHESVQKITDGAIGRYYTVSEWRKELTATGFSVDSMQVMGMKSAILPIPGSRIKYRMLDLVPNSISRLMTNNLRMGSFLVSAATKPVES